MGFTESQWDMLTSELATLKERSPFYAKKFEGIDLSDVRTQADFERLPFSEKDDLRAAYPLGLQAVPDEEVVRIHSSSGTTGTPACWARVRAADLLPSFRVTSPEGPIYFSPA